MNLYQFEGKRLATNWTGRHLQAGPKKVVRRAQMVICDALVENT